MPRYYIDPFGCVKNQVDAENMMAHLNNEGWVCENNPENADTIIVNSCGFIESAKQESIDAVLNWKKIYPNKKIILAGCLAMRYEEELKESLPEADEIITSHSGTAAQRIYKSGERPLLSLPGSAYVKISDGCNNNCSYCAIPLIRGKLKSRTIPDIVDECKTLLNRGIKELCIVGQDIASYGREQGTGSREQLSKLLKAIGKLKGHFWVRLLYIHPDHFPLEILDIMECDHRFLPYFDIPFQHASESILKAMNRHGTADQYLKLIKTIRKRLPFAIIRSTFLLGFPGETEEDFNALLDFQQKAKLNWLGCFAYSREDGTPAFSMKNQVPKKIALERKKIIEEKQMPIMTDNMERFVGQERIALIEEKIKSNNDDYKENFFLGRLYCQAPEIDSSVIIVNAERIPKLGNFVNCKVVARRGLDLLISVI